MSNRAEADIDSLIGHTVASVERANDGGDWAVIHLDGGLSLYVDAPTLYVPTPSPYVAPTWKD